MVNFAGPFQGLLIEHARTRFPFPEITTPGFFVVKRVELIRAFLVWRLYLDMNRTRGSLPRTHASHHQQEGQNHRAIEQVIDGCHKNDGHKGMAQIEIFDVRAGKRKPDYADDGDEL